MARRFAVAPFLLDTAAMGNQKILTTLGLATLGLLGRARRSACSKSSSGSNSSALPDDVTSIVFLQRLPRTDAGNVFEYTSSCRADAS